MMLSTRPEMNVAAQADQLAAGTENVQRMPRVPMVQANTHTQVHKLL